jgi:hypothetical protein
MSFRSFRFSTSTFHVWFVCVCVCVCVITSLCKGIVPFRALGQRCRFGSGISALGQSYDQVTRWQFLPGLLETAMGPRRHRRPIYSVFPNKKLPQIPIDRQASPYLSAAAPTRGPLASLSAVAPKAHERCHERERC